MGTVGGKIGLGAGIISGFLAVEPMSRLFLGDCFFEQGCGGNEEVALAAVTVGSVLVAIAAGLLVREAANRLLRARR